MRWTVQGPSPNLIQRTIAMIEIDIPAVKAEVEAAFAAYERALVGNDVETLDRLFHADPRTIRYGRARTSMAMPRSQPSGRRGRRRGWRGPSKAP